MCDVCPPLERHERQQETDGQRGVSSVSVSYTHLDVYKRQILHMMCERSECIICDSGGKDSSVLKHIALQAKEKYGLQFRVRHNHTTVDAPETVYFVREEKRKFEQMGIPYEIHYPKESMWQLIVRHVTPPTRLMRYCCADLKENTGEFGERIVTGVRKAESNNRKNNQGAITIPKPVSYTHLDVYKRQGLKGGNHSG